MRNIKIICLFLIFIILSCGKDQPVINAGDLEHIDYSPQGYEYKRPPFYPKMEYPADNPPTVEGIALGRRLFYDPILSRDSSMGCFSCHKQELAFTDGAATSIGVDGINGRRSSMSLVDVGFNYRGMFWDGRATTLEEQALGPVTDPVELHTTWPEVEQKLRRHNAYPQLFRKAFGIKDRKEITKELAAKAIAQFERTIMTTGQSKYDRFKQNLDFFDYDESQGLDMFFDKQPFLLPDAQCGHCHNEPMFTTNDYFNNGISPAKYAFQFLDKGRAEFSLDSNDVGKFRTPGLRNIMLTGPYMHDGHLKTIEDVMDHYMSGGHPSPKRDPLIAQIELTQEQRTQIIAFLKTLTDNGVLQDTTLSNPYK
ncbi:MAG: cytochrome C peroxidase [Saprospiraceae bacterium]|nr:cytochrome C peroxidase [Saprospiraceae bacterium]